MEESGRSWRERRQKIIKQLNETADYLSQLHSGTKTADMIGTGVGVGGGILTLITGGVGLVIIGSTQLVGRALSFGAQYYEEDKTRQRLEELQNDYKMLRSIGDTMKRLNQFTTSLNKLIKAGLNKMGNEFFKSNVVCSFLRVCVF